MRLRVIAWVFVVACGSPQEPPAPPPIVEAAPALPPTPPLETPRLASHARAVTDAFDTERAEACLAYVDRYFRVRGNTGYVKTLERVAEELRDGGFDAAHLRTLELGEVRPTWSPRAARLTLLGPAEDDLVRFDAEHEPDRATLLVGSDPTPPTELEVVRLEAVQAGASVANRLVLADGDPRAVFPQVPGARGILVRNLEPYHEAAQHPDVAQFGYLPAHAAPAIGFSLSEADYARLRAATERGPARVRVSADVAIGRGAAGAIEARIDGARPDGAIVYVAHVDEPGANDNASGVATLAELARAMRAAIDAGALPRPARPIVFLFGQEMEIARAWLERATATPGAGLVLDMVGADPEVVGAPFLIERTPDPGAIWLRPPDEHTEWGASEVREGDVRPSFLNDYASAAARVVFDARPWRSHPFEGGSDHVPFLERGVPAVLGWHFTDRAYHTSADRLARVSVAQMERVAAVFGALGAGLASEDEADLLEIVAAVEHHAYARLHHAHAAQDRAEDAALERRVIEAWVRWYDGALTSVGGWPASAPPAVTARVEDARDHWRELAP